MVVPNGRESSTPLPAVKIDEPVDLLTHATTYHLSETAIMAEATALGKQLAAGATKALGAAKQLLHSGWNETLETQMELETRAIADAARTADAQEGIAAFIEKRDPSFKGS